MRLIHKDWIYEFIINYPTAFDIRFVDQRWFLHVVTRGAVPLSFSKTPSKRTESQNIEKPIEFRKTGGYVKAGETHEKIEWLVKNGVRKKVIAEKLGIGSKTLNLSRNLIQKRTALKIDEIFAEYKKNNRGDRF